MTTASCPLATALWGARFAGVWLTSCYTTWGDTTVKVVAGLSFGFWTEALKPDFDAALWNDCFEETFPHLPQMETRASLLEKASSVVELRNRISHHEPIFKRDLSKDFATVMTLLKWICPSTHAWIKPHCRVPMVLRQKPKPRPSPRRTETARHR